MRAISELDEQRRTTAPRTAVTTGDRALPDRARGRALLSAEQRLRQRVRRALPGLEPGLRLLAEGLPAGSGSIDLLGADADGHPVLVVVEADGHTPDERGALALARALGARGWVRSELPGWLQLVPGLDVRRGTAIRCLLLVRELAPALRSALDALPVGWIEPLVYRPFSHRGDEFLLLEQAASPPPERVANDLAEKPPGPLEPEPALPRVDRASPLPTLRSGLTEADFAPRLAGEREAGSARPPRPRFDRAHDTAASAPAAPTTASPSPPTPRGRAG